MWLMTVTGWNAEIRSRYLKTLMTGDQIRGRRAVFLTSSSQDRTALRRKRLSSEVLLSLSLSLPHAAPRRGDEVRYRHIAQLKQKYSIKIHLINKSQTEYFWPPVQRVSFIECQN